MTVRCTAVNHSRREVTTMLRKLFGLPDDGSFGVGQGTSLPLITIVITNLLNNNTVTIRLQDFLNDFAVQLCAAVLSTGVLDCRIID
jgi:hypothetical protein